MLHDIWAVPTESGFEILSLPGFDRFGLLDVRLVRFNQQFPIWRLPVKFPRVKISSVIASFTRHGGLSGR